MQAWRSDESAKWAPIFEQCFPTEDSDLHFGDMHETAWHTVVAELVDRQGSVFLLAEVDPDTKTLVRCRRPSTPLAR